MQTANCTAPIKMSNFTSPVCTTTANKINFKHCTEHEAHMKPSLRGWSPGPESVRLVSEPNELFTLVLLLHAAGIFNTFETAEVTIPGIDSEDYPVDKDQDKISRAAIFVQQRPPIFPIAGLVITKAADIKPELDGTTNVLVPQAVETDNAIVSHCLLQYRNGNTESRSS
jgi:hypothetical protein